MPVNWKSLLEIGRRWNESRKGTHTGMSAEERKIHNREASRKWAKAHPIEVKRNHRRRYPPLSEQIAGYVPLSAQNPIPLPPCGGDCENCPYDDGCHYPDWDEEHSKFHVRTDGRKVLRDNERRWDAARYARDQERRAADPKYDAEYRAKKRAVSAKYRSKVKWVKAGGTPEAFEQAWLEIGDYETFKRIWADGGKLPAGFWAQLSKEKGDERAWRTL